MKVRLVQTCGACPEQYDAYIGDEEIGYLRLRHGFFTAEYKFGSGNIVYETRTIGDGSFNPNERRRHLNAACRALLEAHNNEEVEDLFEIISE